MSWLHDLQKKSHSEKMRIIWLTVALTFILLIGLWVLSSKYRKNLKKDNTIIETLDQGIKDVKDNFNKN